VSWKSKNKLLNNLVVNAYIDIF